MPLSPRELQQILLKRVRRYLLETLELKFACVKDVTALCCQQLKHTELSLGVLAKMVAEVPEEPKAREEWIEKTIEPICERAVQARYVKDCERVAQLLHKDTNSETQNHIRQYYWQEYDRWVKWVVRSRLYKPLGEERVGRQFPSVLTELQEKIFEHELFKEHVEKYQPGKGRTFERFFKTLIKRRLGDLLRRRFGEVNYVPGIDPDAVVAFVGAGLDDKDTAKLRAALKSCLRTLENEESPGNHEFGLELCAVFILQHKVLVDLDFATRLVPKTWQLIEQRSPNGSADIKRISEENEGSSREFRKLERETLSILRSKRTEEYAGYRRRESELERLHYSTDQLDRLKQEATRSNKGDLKKRLQQPGTKQCERDRRCELEFMISYRGYHDAVCKLEGKLPLWGKLDEREGHWIRSQPEIKNILNISQSTVSRRLKQSHHFLSNCLTRKLSRRE